MSKVLVGYWSGTGCTESIATRIGETLAEGGLQVDVRPFDSNPDVSGYDAVVAGSSVRAHSWHANAKKWMARNADVLRTKPLAMFTVAMCLADGPRNEDEARSYTDKMLAKTGLYPRDIGLFAGWFEPEKFNWLERKAMEMNHAPKGDYRDFEAVETWAASLGSTLSLAAAA